MKLFPQNWNLLAEAETAAPGDPPTWVIILIPFVFAIVFPCFWCFVVWSLSRVGGWHRLAMRYHTSEIPEGAAFPGIQAMVGLVSYRGAIDCTITDEGFYLRPMVLFRFGHPALFIPWSECEYVRRADLLWIKWVKIQVGNPSAGTLTLPLQIFEESAGRRLLSPQEKE